MSDPVARRVPRPARERTGSVPVLALALFLPMMATILPLPPPSATGFAPPRFLLASRRPRPSLLAEGAAAPGERDAESEVGEERGVLLHEDADGLGGGAFSSGDDLDDAWTGFRRELILRERMMTSSSSTADAAADDVPRVLSRIEDVDDVGPGTILISSSAAAASSEGRGRSSGRRYLHKAVVFVLERGPLGASGVLLNRGPMFDLGLLAVDGTVLPGSDEGWTVWFGGEDLRGRGEEEEDEEDDVEDFGGGVSDNTFCLFFDDDVDPAGQASVEVADGVRFAFHAGARELVHAGRADPEDFLLFYGHVHWDAGDLEGELRTGQWDAARVVPGGGPSDVLTGVRDRSMETTTTGGKVVVDLTYGKTAWDYARRAMGMPSAPTIEANAETFGDKMLRAWTLLNLPHTRDDRRAALRDFGADDANDDSGRP